MRLTSVLVVGALVGGCSVAGTPKAAPPPPNRTLVAWADIVCTQATKLDNQRAQGSGGDIDYLWTVSSLVDDMIKKLKAIDPAGIAPADTYVKDLVKNLEDLKPRLPKPDSRPKINIPPAEQQAKAKQAFDVIATIEPQRPKLAKIAAGVRDFVNSYNVAPGCEPAAEAEQRALVTWADTMCEAVTTVNGLRTDPASLVDDPGFARDELETHVNTAPTLLRQLSEPISALKPTGVKEADDFSTALLTAVTDATRKLPEGTPADLSISDLTARAGQVAGVLGAVKPKVQGFDAVVEKIADAYWLAPDCAPPDAPKPPLAPKNGTDYQACRSGTCEVRVSTPVEIVVLDRPMRIAVRANNLTITDERGRMTLGDGGAGTFSISGKSIRFHATDMKPTTAVLDISMS